MNSSVEKPPFDGDMDQWTWYHGPISRKRAQELLRSHSEGAYLIRDSVTYKGDLALSVVDQENIKHYRIYYNNIKWIQTTPDKPNPRYSIDNIRFFNNMPQLINHYSSDFQQALCTRLEWGLPKISSNSGNDYVTMQYTLQQQVNGEIPPTLPRKRVVGSMKSNVVILEELTSLKKRVEDLEKEQERFKIRRGQKKLLFHGVTERDNNNVVAVVYKIIKKTFKLQFNIADISRSHRLGQANTNKPRPILVQFKDVETRDFIWTNKFRLEGTGITITEFLTKDISDKEFAEAHQRFGITSCWTEDGVFVVLAADGSEHRVTTLSELSNIQILVETSKNNAASGSDLHDKRTIFLIKRYITKILSKCSRICRRVFCNCHK